MFSNSMLWRSERNYINYEGKVSFISGLIIVSINTNDNTNDATEMLLQHKSSLLATVNLILVLCISCKVGTIGPVGNIPYFAILAFTEHYCTVYLSSFYH